MTRRSSLGPAALKAGIATLLAFILGAAPVVCLWSAIEVPVEADAYFHLAIARDYASSPFAYESRIREGLLAHHAADREPLFHLQLAGLLKVGLPPFTAAMLATAVAGGTIGAILFLYSGSLLVTLCGIFASQTFLYRLHMCRPQGWAIAYVLLGLALMMKGRNKSAAAVNFVYTLSYSVPVVLVGAAFFRALAARDARPFLWMLGASLAGLAVHPHFPQNLTLLWYQGFQVVQNALRNNPVGVSIPDELEPRPFGEFLGEFWLVILLMGLGIARRSGPWWMAVLQVLFFLLSLRMRRLIEYWVPLVILTSGPTLAWAVPKRPLFARAGIVVLLVLVTAVPNMNVALRAARVYQTATYRSAGEWLKANAQGGCVFNAEWGAYPELRFHGGDIRLTHGQDPIFVAAYSPERQRLIDAAIGGNLGVEDFRREIGAEYVVARKGTPILGKFAGGPGVAVKFTDADVVILKVSG